MTCRELIDFLDDYLDSAQPDTVALVKGACNGPPDAPSSDAPPELVQAIPAAIKNR